MKANDAAAYARQANPRQAAVAATSSDPPLRQGSKNLIVDVLLSPQSKPPSEGGDGNTGSGTMAEKRQHEKKISTPPITSKSE